jgi:hypothetical protein
VLCGAAGSASSTRSSRARGEQRPAESGCSGCAGRGVVHQEGGWICRGRRRWPNGVSYEPGWGGSEGFGVIPQSLWDSAGSALI